MEDWQEWQIRADEIASDLNAEIDNLSATYLSPEGDDFKGAAFWRLFRDLKDRVRTAPAIRLEAKLDLERRLRSLGARAYKLQEAANAKSNERKDALLRKIADLRARAEAEKAPQALRRMRRDFEQLREEFDKGPGLSPADRQSVWDAWREANQFSWQRLTDMWAANETELRTIIADARQHAERGNAGGVRQTVSRFFDMLRHREAKQEAIDHMKAEIEEIRRQVEEIEEKATAPKVAAQAVPAVPVTDLWKADLERNREMVLRLREEVAGLERQVSESKSILDQSMLRGTLAEKRRKLNELERANKGLEQKIEQTEETPLMPSA